MKKIFLYVLLIIVVIFIVYQNKSEIPNTQEFHEIPYNAREICSYNNYIYYIIDEKNFTNIIRFDIVKKNTEIIYNYNIVENIDIIELCAINNYLIWIENPINYEWKIIKYNLANKEKSVMRTFEQSNKSFIPTCLSVNNNFLSLYESTYNNKNELEELLIIINIETNEIITKDVYLFGNPYLRPYINNNHISYIIKENDSYYINVCNLINGKIKKVKCISSIAKIISNGDYIVWLDNYDTRNIYIYDIQNKTYNKIDGSINLFTFVLVNNTLYIAYTEDNNGYANIYSIDLINSIRKNITKNNDENVNYYLTRPSIDNKLLYKKIEDGKIKVILQI